MNFKLFASVAMAAALCIGTTAPSLAGTTTSSATLDATLASTCAINSVTAPATQTITVGSAIAAVAGSISLTCTNGAPYNVELGPGNNGTDGATPTRNLKDGAGTTYGYQLWRDSGATLVFGDTIGTNTVAGTGSGSAQGVSFYFNTGVAPTTLTAGTYTDTVGVTVAY